MAYGLCDSVPNLLGEIVELQAEAYPLGVRPNIEAAILKSCREDLSAEATIDHILAGVAAFKGDAPQSDDMTCVVLRVEG
jgi:hypothetical protein